MNTELKEGEEVSSEGLRQAIRERDAVIAHLRLVHDQSQAEAERLREAGEKLWWETRHCDPEGRIAAARARWRSLNPGEEES